MGGLSKVNGNDIRGQLANDLLPQSSVKNVFIRGSVVRYVHLPAAAVDTPLLEDATRRGMATLLDLWKICVLLIPGTEAAQAASKAKQG